jgi:pimeloyl-ACP methyl ester carboxylesterase
MPLDRRTLIATSLAALAAGTASAADLPPDGKLSVAQLRARYMTPADKLVTLGGVEVRYRDEGRGQPILLLHGSQSTLETWDGVADVLKRHYRVIRFDLPPMGLSGSVSEASKATLKGPDDLMISFLDHLKIKQLIAVGVSSGGTMAYYLAAGHPDRVKAIVLSNCPSEPLDRLGLVPPPEITAANARIKATGLQDKAWWRTYLTWLYGDPARITDKKIQVSYDMGRRGAEPNMVHLLALAGNGDETAKRLKAVKAPTLIIWGMRDPVLPPKVGTDLRDRLTGVIPSMVTLDDVGHYPPIEVPERFASIVETYLTQVLPR